MSETVPAAAGRVLEEGVLCYLAAATAAGPHVTPVVYALDGGKLWVTTARRSVKASSWRRDPRTAGLVRAGSAAVVFTGRVRAYDALDPFTWPAALLSAPRLAMATTTFSLKNARFFAGYAVDARRVPFSWSPPGRVFAGITIEAGRLLDLDAGRVVEGWGPRPEGSPEDLVPDPPLAKGLDLAVPQRVREAVGEQGEGALALSAGSDLEVFPVAWRRMGDESGYDARMPKDFVPTFGARAAMRGGLAVDRASAWRASEMKGMLLRGPVELSSAGANRVVARLRPTRVVWWDGWSSGTVRAR